MTDTHKDYVIAQLRRSADSIERVLERVSGIGPGDICYTDKQSRGQIIDLRQAADALESSRAEVERLREALTDLQACERVYRTAHDVHGGDAIITGRAWDKMRKSGDRARSILDPKQA